MHKSWDWNIEMLGTHKCNKTNRYIIIKIYKALNLQYDWMDLTECHKYLIPFCGLQMINQ
jgi:hypothetical protein